MEQQLPPGLRFYPTEEELITFYLHNKLHAHHPDHLRRVIPSVDIYNFEPSQLPGLAGELCHGDTEQWFFFMPQQEREARGGRPNRTTATGYWKATGSPSYVYSSNNNRVIGVKKTMVFYEGKAPSGRKTTWKMNEYKAINQLDFLNNITSNASPITTSTIPTLRHELSLCRVYITSGCARAFDRRPPGTTPSNNNLIDSQSGSNYQAVGGSGTAASQSDQKASTLMLMEKSSSTDHSSNSRGDDHHGNLHEAAFGSSKSTYQIDHMVEDLGTLCNFELLDWLEL